MARSDSRSRSPSHRRRYSRSPVTHRSSRRSRRDRSRSPYSSSCLGKIVFAAPSRPLVVQQIEACHNIVGIPQEWTIDLTGQTCPSKRASLWQSKRVFLVTPQVLEKDIHSGTCLMKYLVCLVIDEAHRALGNYSYCVVVRENGCEHTVKVKN